MRPDLLGTPWEMRRIYSTLAEAGIFGADAEKYLEATASAAWGTPDSKAAEEAHAQLRLPGGFVSLAYLAKDLVAARGLMEEIDYVEACLKRFGAEGAVFPLLAPIIHDALNPKMPAYPRKTADD